MKKVLVVHHGEYSNLEVLSFVSRCRHFMWIATFRLHGASLQATRLTYNANRELKQLRRQRQQSRHLILKIWEMVIIFSSSHPFFLTEHAENGLGEVSLK